MGVSFTAHVWAKDSSSQRSARLTEDGRPQTPSEYLDVYGSYALPEEKARLAQSALEGMVERLREPGDPPYRVVFVNSPDKFAQVHFAQRAGEPATILISHGFMATVKDESEMAGVLGHEMEHPTSVDAMGSRGEYSNRIQEVREELDVADKGSIRRTARAGYDPTALRRWLLRNADATREKIRIVTSALAAHGSIELRITRYDLNLMETERKVTFAKAKPLSNALKEVQASAATPHPVKKEPVHPSYVHREPPKEPELRQITSAEVLEKLQADRQFKALSREAQLQVLLEYSSSDHVRMEYANWYFGKRDPQNKREWPGKSRYELHLAFSTNEDRAGTASDRARHHKLFNEFDYQMDPKDRETALGAYAQKARAGNAAEQAHAVELLGQLDVPRANGRMTEVIAEAQSSIRPVPPIRSIADYRRAASGLTKYQQVAELGKLLAVAKDDETLAGILVELRATGQNIRNVSFTRRLYTDRLPEMAGAAARLGLRPQNMGLGWPITQEFGTTHYRPDSIMEAEHLALRSLVIGNNAKHLSAAEKLAILMNQLHASQAPHTSGWSRQDEESWTLYEKYQALVRQEVSTPDDVLRLQSEMKALYSSDLLKGRTEDRFPRSFGFGSAELVALLDAHPQWNFTAAQVKSFTEDALFWPSVDSYYSSRRDLADNRSAYEMLRDRVRSLDDRDLERSLIRLRDQFRGPAYQYNSMISQKIQSRLVNGLKHSGEMPKDAQGMHQLVVSLAKRGPSDLTDQMSRELYLKPGFSCAACIQEALEQGTVFDFEDRYKMDQRRAAMSGGPAALPSDPKARLHAITDEIARVSQIFPEETLVRARVLEEYANRIGANYAETEILHAAKFTKDENLVSLAYRTFSPFLEALFSEKNPDEAIVNFLRFLRGETDDTPVALKDLFKTISKDRLRRQFQALTPEIRAVVINPLLTPPRGVYANPAARARLIELAVANTGSYQGHARKVLESLLYALNKESPFQETLALSFVLGQGGKSSMTPGKSFAVLLGSMGNTGTSIGQKLYQRRLVPVDILDELAVFQEKARAPDRIEVFRLAARRLGIDPAQIDEVFSMVNRLGDASAKVVFEIMYKDGRISKDQSLALKLLWDDFERTNDLEVRKLSHMLDYLERDGEPSYRKLRSGLKAVERSLRTQADLRSDLKNHPDIARLYGSGKVDPESGFRFVVMEQHEGAGIAQDYSHESVARGKSLSELTESERKEVYRAIYLKERGILLAEPDADGMIAFEADRHRGNFKVNLSTKPPEIYIFDYPQTSRISATSRSSLFRVLGMLSAGEGADRMAGLITTELLEQASPTKRDLVSKAIESTLRAAGGASKRLASDTVMDIFSILEGEGLRVKPEIYDYLVAIGNGEHYAAVLVPPGGKNPLIADIGQAVRQTITLGDRCAVGWGKIGRLVNDSRKRP